MPSKKQQAEPASTPLFNDIYNGLLHEIFRGELGSGTYLAEGALAERFGVSRTPIREALVHLVNDGFLEKAAFRSYVVADASAQSARELYDLRLLLEPAAAAQAATNPLGMNAVNRAQQTIEGMRDFPPKVKDIDRLIAFSELDSRFHQLIAEASGNKYMTRFITELTKHNQRFWMLSNSETAPLSKTVAEHTEILDSIRSRKPEEAAKRITDHLTKARSRLRL